MYTTSIQKILQSYLINYLGYTDKQAFYTGYSQTIQLTHTYLFNFDYPIFDPTHKAELETKILKHYYLREVAHQTVEAFKLALDDRLNNIMPYYNQLYYSASLKIDPLINHKYTEDKNFLNKQTGTIDNQNLINTTNNLDTSMTTDSETHDNSTNTRKTWEQPQSGALVTDEYISRQEQDTLKDDLTGTTSSTGKNTGKTTTQDDGKTNTEQTIMQNDSKNMNGVIGISESRLLMEYRETILNIDNMIIKDLYDLFYMLMD